MGFDVLSRELNVFAPLFLEASAGTGKTFAIEHLVVRLLIEKEPALGIEQILVVTFTRAAARELRMRIRRNLSQIKQALSTSDLSIDYLKAICEKGEKAVQAAIEKIDTALICFDRAQIYTLHGFCHRILNEFAFEANIGFTLSDPEDQEYSAFSEEIVKKFLKEEIKLPEYSPTQIRLVLNRYQRDPKRLVRALSDLITSTKDLPKVLNHAELLVNFLRQLQSLPSIRAGEFKEDLARLLPMYKKMTGDEIPQQIELLSEILETKQCSAQQLDQLTKGEFFLENLTSSNLKVRAKLADVGHLHYPGLVEKLREGLLPWIRKAGDPILIYLRLARDIRDASKSIWENEEKLSPDALLLKVEKALSIPRFVERVRKKFRAAIVDEFQDTDPIQWNIFQKLFLKHIDVICLVGDPKQSIYAFRNADVYTYLAAAKAMGPAAKKHLDTNFRSTKQLVAALNALFSKVQGMPLPGAQEMLEIASVKAGAKIASDDQRAPIEFFVVTGKKGRSRKFPTDEMFDKKVFPFIAKEILRLHRDNKQEFHEIAILIKDRFQAQFLIDELKRFGVPAYYKRGVSIIESFAYHALKEVLAAVLAPYDMSKVKAALAGAIMGWTEAQLSGEDVKLLEAKAKMQGLHQLLFHKGFGAFFQSFLTQSWRNDSSLMQDLIARGELALYLDLRKLAEILIEEELLQGLKGESFLIYLEQMKNQARFEEARFKVVSQEEKGSVVVMTMHMSKGLEFDTVFALGLTSRHKPGEYITLKQQESSVLAVYDPAELECEKAIEELDAEKMRQLYVAFTRAKKRLYLPLILDEEQKEIDFGEASPMELFIARLLNPTVNHRELYLAISQLEMSQVLALLESLSPHVCYQVLSEEKQEIAPILEKPVPFLLPPNELNLPKYLDQIYSFTALAKKESSMETLLLSENAPLSAHSLPLGSQTGHLLHLLFEQIFRRGLHTLHNKEALQALIDEQIAFSPLEKIQSIFLPWLIELLEKPIADLRLCDIPGLQLQQEMEFFFPFSQGIMKGFADLFFEFNGKYYLLDWKSNYLGPSDEDYTFEKMEQAMQKNDYYLQASIYAAALMRYVKLFDNRPFSECFGGAIYYFVRGKAAHHFIPKPFSTTDSKDFSDENL